MTMMRTRTMLSVMQPYLTCPRISSISLSGFQMDTSSFQCHLVYLLDLLCLLAVLANPPPILLQAHQSRQSVKYVVGFVLVDRLLHRRWPVGVATGCWVTECRRSQDGVKSVEEASRLPPDPDRRPGSPPDWLRPHRAQQKTLPDPLEAILHSLLSPRAGSQTVHVSKLGASIA